jgi:DNA-binding NtrC family response regulator
MVFLSIKPPGVSALACPDWEMFVSRAINKTSTEAFSILVVDDEPGIQDFLQRALSKVYDLVQVASSVKEADVLRKEHHFDLMIIDICMPETSGVEWLKEIKQKDCQADVIFMTAFSDVDNAIEALRIGAFDFIRKPFRLEEMTLSVERCFKRRRLERENLLLKKQMDNLYPFDGMIGNSPQVQETCQLITRVAPTPSLILIEGETGTGKELVANAIHKQSARSGPFVPVNCGAISPELLESEFFGHKKGAFTGAEKTHEGLFAFADGGTLFLDEVGEMPLQLQAKFLRVLEEGTIRPVGSEREMPVNVRLVAATNRDLKQEVAQGRFREDLYYRLNILSIRLAPLRERKQDIAPLVAYYNDKLAKSLALPPLPITHQDIKQLEAYDWPGNVRELKNTIERCLLLGKLPDDMVITNSSEKGQQGYPDDWSLEQVEESHIAKVLQRFDGNKNQAAKTLGVSSKTLYRRYSQTEQD